MDRIEREGMRIRAKLADPSHRSANPHEMLFNRSAIDTLGVRRLKLIDNIAHALRRLFVAALHHLFGNRSVEHLLAHCQGWISSTQSVSLVASFEEFAPRKPAFLPVAFDNQDQFHHAQQCEIMKSAARVNGEVQELERLRKRHRFMVKRPAHVSCKGIGAIQADQSSPRACREIQRIVEIYRPWIGSVRQPE